MTDAPTNLTDTSTWLPLDGLAPGFDANRAPHTTALAGRDITIVDGRGTRIRHLFGETGLHWSYTPGEGDETPAQDDDDDYIAFEVADGLYFAQFHHRGNPMEAVSLVLDLRDGRALSVISLLGEAAEGRTAVQQFFVPAVIEGAETRGAAACQTTELIGRRALWVYSSVHAYEHVYLSPQWYTWQCLGGPERGQADTDECSTWQVRPGIYIFAWREKVIPCASVTIADHRNINHMRSHGVLFGYDESGTEPVHFTFGAYGRLLSTTVHPAQYDPAGVGDRAAGETEATAGPATAQDAVSGVAGAGAWSMR